MMMKKKTVDIPVQVTKIITSPNVFSFLSKVSLLSTLSAVTLFEMLLAVSVIKEHVAIWNNKPGNRKIVTCDVLYDFPL